MFGRGADFDDLWVWSDGPLARGLAWYRAVAENRAPAKLLIAGRIRADVDLEDDEDAALWAELDRKIPRFVEAWTAARAGREPELDCALDAASACARPAPSLVDLAAALARRTLSSCSFCRWNCRVDRSTAGAAKLGTCKLAADTRVSTYFHHRGEELVYRGTEGSGTIFFTSCNMRCAFCQNGDISTDKENGDVVSAHDLALMAWLLRMEGCHNINWVGGEVTIHLHTILEAIALLEALAPTARDLRRAGRSKSDGAVPSPLDRGRATYRGLFNAPLLWNSNFFMSADTMKLLRVLMDVWLPDFKFGPGACGVALSRTPWYWETVTTNLKLIHGWGEGLTIRHLVMPDHVECCTRPVLEWIADNMPDVPVNVMDQYHPDNFCDPRSPKYQPRYGALARRPTGDEIERAFAHAKALGLHVEPISSERRQRRAR